MILHRGPERQVQDALVRLRDMPEVRDEPVLITVVGSGEAPS